MIVIITMNPIISIIALVLTVAGGIIFLTGGIGYGVSKHQHNIFDATICEVTDHPTLATKSCTWCRRYTCCHEESYQCGCDSDGNNCRTCWRTVCNSCCDYISYTCSAARWEVVYNTTGSCPDPSMSIITGSYQKSSGDRATDDSRSQALQDQATRPVESEDGCYFNTKKCNQARWRLFNLGAWYKAFLSGGIIFGIGLMILCLIWCWYKLEQRRYTKKSKLAVRIDAVNQTLPPHYQTSYITPSAPPKVQPWSG